MIEQEKELKCKIKDIALMRELTKSIEDLKKQLNEKNDFPQPEPKDFSELTEKNIFLQSQIVSNQEEINLLKSKIQEYEKMTLENLPSELEENKINESFDDKENEEKWIFENIEEIAKNSKIDINKNFNENSQSSKLSKNEENSFVRIKLENLERAFLEREQELQKYKIQYGNLSRDIKNSSKIKLKIEIIKVLIH